MDILSLGVNCAHYQNLGFVGFDMLTDIIPHRHDYFEIAITVENGYTYVINDKKVSPHICAVYIMRLNDWHELRVIPGAEKHICLVFSVPPDMFREACMYLSPELYSDITEGAEVPYFHISASSLHSLVKRAAYPLFAVRDAELKPETIQQLLPVKKAIITELLGQYLYYQAQTVSNLPECLVRLTKLLAEDEKYTYFRVSQLSEVMNYSQAYLCRQFSRCFNTTLERYLIERRIEKAAFMLLSGNLTINQIARKSGWKKTGNFINEFKRVYGETPSKYRQGIIKTDNSLPLTEISETGSQD